MSAAPDDIAVVEPPVTEPGRFSPERLRRAAPWLAAAVVALLLAALVGVASEPTGAPTLNAALDSGDRYAAQAPVGDAEVVLVSRGADLAVLVGWQTGKGWLVTELGETEADPVAAWAATSGNDDIPALAAAFGRGAPLGGSVEVVWADGVSTTTSVAGDSTWLAVREGEVGPDRVTFLDAAGGLVNEVTEL